MVPRGSHRHAPMPTVGPLTDTAFVRRTAREREGLPGHPRSATSDRRKAWDGGMVAALTRYLDGALAWPLRPRRGPSAKPPERDARDQRLG